MPLISQLKKIKNHFLRKSKLKKVIKNIGDNILLSSDFKNNDLKKCFDEKKINTVDERIIERIIKAYIKAKAVQENLPEAYQVGNEWLPIYNRYMQDTMLALSNSDKVKINKIYENFMRESCSMGLHGLPVSMKDAYFNGSISKLDGNVYLHDAIYRYNHWKELTDNKYSVTDLYMPNHGNPYGYFINDQFVRTGAEYLHYYATRISALVNDEPESKIVVELGGGYGGLGYFLNKLIPDLTYIDFDLPENMALTAYYLMNSFPEKKVLLFGEGDFNEESIKKFDIIIMPNFELPNLPSEKINLVFNSYSLAEMSTATIKTYIPELKRASKEYIFHVNHTQESNSLKADEFGIEGADYKLISRTPALWNLGRNANMDEYEYLYTRKPIEKDNSHLN